jgi:hypothetical protein
MVDSPGRADSRALLFYRRGFDDPDEPAVETLSFGSRRPGGSPMKM